MAARPDRVQRVWDRVWLVALLGFSTQILWITTRGGVWHTGPSDRDAADARLPHRAVGEAPGVAHRAARRGRVPDACAARLRGPVLCPRLIPESAWSAADLAASSDARGRDPWRSWVWLAAGVLPSIVFFFLYNQLRFDNPLGVGLRAGDAAAVARGAARAGAVLARPRPDEPRLPVLPPADAVSSTAASSRSSARTAWG